jgi:rubredoxin
LEFHFSENRINVRHASNELNWQIEDQCEYALKLKHQLARHFDQEDIRTFRLCFAIKVNPKTGLFGSVIIKKHYESIEGEQDQFEILHTRDFNPNSKDFITYRSNVCYNDLAATLMELCDYFYNLQTNGIDLAAIPVASGNDVEQTEEKIIVHQCKHCGTVYDKEFGDECNNITKGIDFEYLPETYACPTCDSPKTDFIEVDRNSLAQLVHL